MVDAPYAIREMNSSCRAAAGSCFGVLSMVDAPYTPVFLVMHQKGKQSKIINIGNKLYVREISTSKIFKGNKNMLPIRELSFGLKIIREISFGSKIIREISF